MEYRKIGGTDLELPVIVFGAWAAGGWMWGGTERGEAIDAIRRSYDGGVTAIDTAPIYGQGDSEEIVAEAIKELPRDKVQILTKFGMRWDLAKGDFAMKSKNNNGEDIEVYKYAGRESIIRECEDSLRRLKTDYIDLYQIHWPDTTTPIQETMETVAELVKQGKVRHVGVCNYNAAQVQEANNYINIVSDQVPYSMVKRGIEEELVPYITNEGKSIIAYSPLERGLLTGKMKPGHSFVPGDHRAGLKLYSDKNLERVNAFMESLRPLAEEKNATLSQLVLRWTIDQPGITVALAGARNAHQSVQNAKAADIMLTSEDKDFIDHALVKLELDR